jgi:divalent metal cation (Fe/Co/Zn/Cd) transporter
VALSLTAAQTQRAARAGVRIEQITVAWMLVEAALSIGAGLLAHSLLLVAFGLDSAIELITGAILLWRLSVQARGASLARVETAERRSAWVVAVALVVLCLCIVASVGIGLYTRARPDTSILGLGVAAVAVIGMPLLARRKRQLATQLDSAALLGDAACSMTCAAMAATLFVGLALNAFLGWWWAESVAALAFLVWLIPEAREALEGARAQRGACACGDDDCDD